MILRSISLLIISLVISSCAVFNKKEQAPEKPSWIETTPVINGYYVGVGSALKTVDIQSYKNKAKSKALSNLSSSIAVNISSSSMVHRFENSAGYSDDFQSKIKSSSNQFLEGFELAGSFDDGTYYWEYYKLSKAKYEELKAKRIKEACSIASDFLAKAEAEKEQSKIVNSVTHYVKGLEAVKQFWSEPLEYNHNGQNVYLGNELFSGVSDALDDIIIEPVKPTLSVKSGSSSSDSQIEFYIKSKGTGKTLQGIPVIFYANEIPVLNNKTVSDSDGKVFYSLSQLSLKQSDIQFVATLNLEEVAKKSTRDIVIKKIISTINVNKGIVNVMLENPTFHVLTEELSNGKPLKNKQIRNNIEQLLTESGFPVSTSQSDCDYILKIKANAKNSKQDGGMIYAAISCEFKVFNANMEVVFSKNLNSIEGVHTNYEKAVYEAYKNLNQYLSEKTDTFIEEAIK